MTVPGLMAAVIVRGALSVHGSVASADALRIAQAPATTSDKSPASTEKTPGKAALGAVKARGTIEISYTRALAVSLDRPAK